MDAPHSRSGTGHSVCRLRSVKLIAKGSRFVVPAIYYVSRYPLPRPVAAKFLLIALGIGFQGFLGWYMVKSGLDKDLIDAKGVPRVSQYRLAAHQSAALALYIGMLHSALSIRRDLKTASLSTAGDAGRAAVSRLAEIIASPAVRRYRGLVRTAGGMVFLTAVSGAFVAGLDAGLVYNEFPTMGGRLVPPSEELMDVRYAKASDRRDRWWRNMLENPVTAQFDHRLLVSATSIALYDLTEPQAISTFTVLISLPLIIRLRILRTGVSALPVASRRLADLTGFAALGQVTLGITTLLYLVPVPLAAMHQAGSVVLLTCLTALGLSLRTPGRALSFARRGMDGQGRIRGRIRSIGYPSSEAYKSTY